MAQGGPVPCYFSSVKMKRMREEESYPAKMLRSLDMVNLPEIVGGRRVAVKVHLGEGTNFQTVHPGLVRLVVERIKAAGGNPFVVHSWGALDAYKRGYSAETLGCPVIPTGGTQEKYYYRHPVDQPELKEVYVAGEIEDAEALVCISHVKGHGSSGMGGALKNIGIGMLSADSRSNVHRLISSVKYWDAEKCDKGCTACVDACPVGAIHWSGENKDELHIDVHSCNYCGACEKACPKDALHLKPAEMFGVFQEGMAHAARAVMSTFEPGHALFINFILHVTPWCDCAPYTMPAFIRDVGVLVATDPVAIDQASLDLIAQQDILTDMVPEQFQVGSDGHPFQRVLGVVKDPYEQVRQAERLGVGTREYELVEISAEPEASTHMHKK